MTDTTLSNADAKPNAKSSYSRADLHQQVTDTIIAPMEAGTAPWHQPWVGGNRQPFRLPVNARTAKAYSGINILLLWCAVQSKEFASHEWATLKQWNAQKESIRKGEKGNMIVYYDTFEKEVDNEIQRIPFLKRSYVFNRCQLASYTPDESPTPPVTSLVERLENVERFVANTKATIRHQGYSACYIPSADAIHMPEKNSFINTEHSTATENYYSTLMHEMTHWSGHPNRLNRKLSGRFGDVPYAEEELIAELSAAFLCAELEITNTPKREHASYLANWLTVLKQDKHAIIAAASRASKTVEYLRGLL
mgnify:CR=1 FL=1